MGVLIPDAKRGLEFFVESMVGETISQLTINEDGVCIRMKSGLRVKIMRSYSTDILGEKVVGFEFQFPQNLNVVTLSLASGRKVVMLL